MPPNLKDVVWELLVSTLYVHLEAYNYSSARSVEKDDVEIPVCHVIAKALWGRFNKTEWDTTDVSNPFVRHILVLVSLALIYTVVIVVALYSSLLSSQAKCVETCFASRSPRRNEFCYRLKGKSFRVEWCWLKQAKNLAPVNSAAT